MKTVPAIAGQAGATTFTDTNAANLAPLFYRVRVGPRHPKSEVREIRNAKTEKVETMKTYPSKANRSSKFKVQASWFNVLLLLPLVLASAARAHAADWHLVVALGYGNAGIVHYDGTTKAYLGSFVPVGSGGMGHPQALTVGPDGNLYVAVCHSDGGSKGGIKRYNGQTGMFMDSFQAMSEVAGVPEPFSPTFGPDGNLYVSNWRSSEILRYNPTNGLLIDVFIPAGRGGLVNPVGLLFAPGDNCYVCSGFRPDSISGNGVLRFSATTGAFKDTLIAEGSGGLRGPAGLTFGPDGNLYVAGYWSDNVLRYNGTNGTFINAFIPAKPASQPGALSRPGPLKFGPDGHLYVDCLGTKRVQRYDGLTGAFLDTFATLSSDSGPAGDIAFFSPAPPQLGVAAPLTNGQFSLRLRGTPGIKYVIQTSTDLALTNWIALVTNAVVAGTESFSFTDTHATNGTAFYRAVKQ